MHGLLGKGSHENLDASVTSLLFVNNKLPSSMPTIVDATCGWAKIAIELTLSFRLMCGVSVVRITESYI